MKAFTLKYADQTNENNRDVEEVELRLGDGATARSVYRTAMSMAPEGKDLRQIKFEGTALWNKRHGWTRGEAYRRAFP